MEFLQLLQGGQLLQSRICRVREVHTQLLQVLQRGPFLQPGVGTLHEVKRHFHHWLPGDLLISHNFAAHFCYQFGCSVLGFVRTGHRRDKTDRANCTHQAQQPEFYSSHLRLHASIGRTQQLNSRAAELPWRLFYPDAARSAAARGSAMPETISVVCANSFAMRAFTSSSIFSDSTLESDD